MKPIFFFLSFLLTLVINSCDSDTEKAPGTTKTKSVDSTDVKPSVDSISELNKKILSYLKAKNYSALTSYFHPQKKVLFSPYAYIDSTVVSLNAQQFNQLLTGEKKIKWGVYDGSGDIILLNLKEYMQRFVYNADFLDAEKVSRNKTLAKGNSLHNLRDKFPDAEYIENYFSGFDKKYNGMDWTALTLVFEKYAGRYYLTALIHDQWTI